MSAWRLACLVTCMIALPMSGAMGQGLRAAFTRVDLTPAPGPGLQGHGPEGARARGHRQRLYARILVMVDANDDTLALVVADLQAVSSTMQREIAARAQLGLSRVLLTATHTHAAPGHYNSANIINDASSSVHGFDSDAFEFLVTRMVDSLAAALAPARLRPARAAWGAVDIGGVSRNRSYEPYLHNQSPVPPDFPAPMHAAVNSTWLMLRVDVDGDRTGAFSLFAVHPTVFPAANDLFDADLFAYVNRAVARHIDRVHGTTPPAGASDPRPRSVHLWANGAEGDVSPAWRAETRCGPPRFTRGILPGGPRTPPSPGAWSPADRPAGACVDAARDDLVRIGDAIAVAATRLYDRLGSRLERDITVGSNLRSIDLAGLAFPGGLRLPDEGAIGASMIGGAEDGRTRFYGGRAFWTWSAGMEEGGPAVDNQAEDPLQAPKRRPAPLIYGSIVQDNLPDVAHLMTVRIGGTYLAAVPAEVTTVAGYRIEEAVRAGLTDAGAAADAVAMVGLANGYLLYVTTPEEYMRQHYEGGATLYGHQELPVLERLFRRLAADFVTGAAQPPGPVKPLPARSDDIWPDARGGTTSRRIFGARCESDRVHVTWSDARPGDLVPADGLLYRLDFSPSGGGSPIAAWDDDPRVETRWVRRGLFPWVHAWRATVVLGGTSGGYTFTLLRPTSAGTRIQATFRCP